MADWSLPTTGSKYVDYTAQLNARLNDLAYGLDPAVTSASNALTNFTRWSSANSRWEKYNGTSWVQLASTYAISVSGSAGSLATARDIALTGDVTGSASFNGSANTSISATLANSGVGAGSYGSATQVPVLSVDAKGRITGVTLSNVTPAWSSITGKPTTLAGFGISNAVANAGGFYSIQYGAPIELPAAGIRSRLFISTDHNVYVDNGTAWALLSPAQNGDVTRAAGSNTLTLAASGVTAGTYLKVTVDAKGRVTAGGTLLSSDIATALGYTPASPYEALMLASTQTVTGVKTFANGSYPTLNDTSLRFTLPTYAEQGLDWTFSNSKHVNWTANDTNKSVQLYDSNLAANRFRSASNGDFIVLGTVTQGSDETLKTNWRNLPSDFVSKLATVKSGIYDRVDIGTTQVGVGAQSFKPLMPWAVHTDEITGLLSVSYGNAALVACIELAKEVVRLRDKVDALS